MYSVVYSDWDLVSFIVHYHCTFEAHKFYHYSMSVLIVCLVYAGERIRNRTNKRCIQRCSGLRLGEFHRTLSPAHKSYHYSMPDLIVCLVYAGEWIRNHTNKRCIQWCTWLRLGEFHHTLSLHIWSTPILPLYSLSDLIVCLVYAGERIRNHTNNRCFHWCTWLRLGEFHHTLLLHIWSTPILPLYSMSDLIVCPVYAGERIRNRSNKRCIQRCTWLRLGEFHHTLSLHIWSTLILPLTNVWSDRLSYICRRTNKEHTNKRSIQRCTWLRLGEFHRTLSLHIWSTPILPLYSMSDLIVCPVYAGERIRNRSNKRSIQRCTWLRRGEFHRTVSLHIWSTLILPLFMIISLCISRRTNEEPHYIQQCTWLRLGEFHRTLSLHIWSTLILPLTNVWSIWSFVLYMQDNE